MSRGGGSPALLTGLIVAQLLGVSLWFVSSAVLPSLVRDWGLRAEDGGLLISAVQVGFITGTVALALTNLADLFSPSRVYLAATLLAAGANLLFAYAASGLAAALVLRFVTGLAIAGIYPVGMKIIVSHFPGAVGHALGWLLGAITVGIAVPFLVAGVGVELSWQAVITTAAGLTVLAGLGVLAVGDGPSLPPAPRLEWAMAARVFRIPAYRASALGYFGHCWEIFALWVISPLLVIASLDQAGWAGPREVGLVTFAVIAFGGVGCAAGGWLSRRVGSLAVAAGCLVVSSAFCLAAPWLAGLEAAWSLPLLALWNLFAVADSPQYSAMSSRACPPAYVGTGLTVQNSIGFAITVAAIEVCYRAWLAMGPYVGWLMAPGPLLGLWFLLREYRKGPLPPEGAAQAAI